MAINWEQAKPGPELDDRSKALVRDVAEHFLSTGTGLEYWEKRVSLGKDRRLLDELVPKNFVMYIHMKCYPRFAALYYLRPDQRTRCEAATTWVLKASQALCKARRPQTFSLVEISDEINRLAPQPPGEHAARIGLQFARDFTNYFGNFENSADIPATSASVWETILDFEDLQLAWREELDRRQPVPVAFAAPMQPPVSSLISAAPTPESSADKARRVFVIHGRDGRLRVGTFTFLRALGLEPLEWIKATHLTGKASPYIGEILDAAFKHAQAAVVLLTPDDEAKLREDLLQPDDAIHERQLTGQARPNVLFEAGMAFASHPNQTVLVQFGQVRPFSDVAGRHVVKMDNSAQKRHELASKLRTTGCSVDTDGSDWQSAGDLTPPAEASKPSTPKLNQPTSKPQAAEPKTNIRCLGPLTTRLRMGIAGHGFYEVAEDRSQESHAAAMVCFRNEASTDRQVKLVFNARASIVFKDDSGQEIGIGIPEACWLGDLRNVDFPLERTQCAIVAILLPDGTFTCPYLRRTHAQWGEGLLTEVQRLDVHPKTIEVRLIKEDELLLAPRVFDFSVVKGRPVLKQRLALSR